MRCLHPIVVRGNQVSCGQCLNCRINRAQAWKLRLLYELQQWDNASFVTLTYNTRGLLTLADESKLPINSLWKPEAQRFMKRLRKALHGRKIKFYLVGEYGTKMKRAHYHAIIFGVNPFNDDDRNAIANSWLPRCDDWHFWRSRGTKSAIQNVTPEDIQYVAGYVVDKLSGDLAKKEYGGRVPPFSLMSKGLGLAFAEENVDRLRKGWTYSTNGKRVQLPRYYREKFGIEPALQKPFVCDLRKDFDDSIERFYERFPSCRNHPEQAARLFEYWLDKNQFALSRQVFDDFQLRSGR